MVTSQQCHKFIKLKTILFFLNCFSGKFQDDSDLVNQPKFGALGSTTDTILQSIHTDTALIIIWLPQQTALSVHGIKVFSFDYHDYGNVTTSQAV